MAAYKAYKAGEQLYGQRLQDALHHKRFLEGGERAAGCMTDWAALAACLVYCWQRHQLADRLAGGWLADGWLAGWRTPSALAARPAAAAPAGLPPASVGPAPPCPALASSGARRRGGARLCWQA